MTGGPGPGGRPPGPLVTWKVWGPDTWTALCESPSGDIARGTAEALAQGGLPVILESPEGREWAWRGGIWVALWWRPS